MSWSEVGYPCLRATPTAETAGRFARAGTTSTQIGSDACSIPFGQAPAAGRVLSSILRPLAQRQRPTDHLHDILGDARRMVTHALDFLDHEQQVRH